MRALGNKVIRMDYRFNNPDEYEHFFNGSSVICMHSTGERGRNNTYNNKYFLLDSDVFYELLHEYILRTRR